MSTELIETQPPEPPLFTGTQGQLAHLLSAHRYNVRQEKHLGDAIEAIFKGFPLQYRREAHLTGTRFRIDFFVPGPDIGVELKVVGGPSIIMRQLYQYARSPQLNGIILATLRGRSVGRLPALIAGKPLTVINLGESGIL